MGDSQRGQSVFEQHLTALSDMRPQPQLLLHLGDTAQRPHIDGDWDQRFFGPLQRSTLVLPMLLVQGNHDVFTEALASDTDTQPASLPVEKGSVMVNPSLLSYQGSGVRLPTYFATSLAGVRWIVLDTNVRGAAQLQVSVILINLLASRCSIGNKHCDKRGSGCGMSCKVRRPLQPIFALFACTYRRGSSFGIGSHGATVTLTARVTKRIHCTFALTYCRLCLGEESTW